MGKLHPPSRTVTVQSEAEAFVVQHALAFYRDMKRNAPKALFGEFLNYAEAIAVSKGRELVQASLQTLVQEEVNEVEKKTRRNSVEPVARKNGIGAGAPKKLKPPQEP